MLRACQNEMKYSNQNNSTLVTDAIVKCASVNLKYRAKDFISLKDLSGEKYSNSSIWHSRIREIVNKHQYKAL